jgi:hypothetical protein
MLTETPLRIPFLRRWESLVLNKSFNIRWVIHSSVLPRSLFHSHILLYLQLVIPSSLMYKANYLPTNSSKCLSWGRYNIYTVNIFFFFFTVHCTVKKKKTIFASPDYLLFLGEYRTWQLGGAVRLNMGQPLLHHLLDVLSYSTVQSTKHSGSRIHMYLEKSTGLNWLRPHSFVSQLRHSIYVPASRAQKD